MHKPTRIILTRAEGPTNLCVTEEIDGSAPFNPFIAADAILRRWAYTAPDDGSYDKCDFAVYYDGGEHYEGRFDLQRRHSAAASLLLPQMRRSLAYVVENPHGRFNQPTIEAAKRLQQLVEPYPSMVTGRR